MIIGIEGIDKAGKTTYAGLLAEEFQYRGKRVEVRHFSQPRTHPLNEYELGFEQEHPLEDVLICDRLHWGELVYGPIYRGSSRLDDAQFLHVEMFLRSRGALMVYLAEPVETLVRRMREDKEDFLQEAHLDEAVRRYDEIVATWTQLPTYQAMSCAWLADRASSVAEEYAALREFPTYIGSRYPSYLLLGDKRGKTHRQALDRHPGAFTPFPGSSGHYLMQALPHAHRARFGIANANEENVHDLWRALGHPLVVALGANANERCDEQGLPHGTMPHPQRIRRFHHRDRDAYGRAIVLAASRAIDMHRWPQQ